MPASSTPRRILVDTEWTAAPWSEEFELLWIGLADEAGAALSAVAAELDGGQLAGSELMSLIPADEPRLARGELAAAVLEFCGDVDEFWAWIPSLERVAEWFGLGDDAEELYARYRDVDLQQLRALVDPWPEGWPNRLLDLNAAAADAGVEIPARSPDHLSPRVHAQWNRRLLEMILQAREGGSAASAPLLAARAGVKGQARSSSTAFCTRPSLPRSRGTIERVPGCRGRSRGRVRASHRSLLPLQVRRASGTPGYGGDGLTSSLSSADALGRIDAGRLVQGVPIPTATGHQAPWQQPAVRRHWKRCA